MDKDVYVGIDVSKTELVVAVRPSSESFTLAYHRAGLKQLVGLAALAGLCTRAHCLLGFRRPSHVAGGPRLSGISHCCLSQRSRRSACPQPE